MNEEKFNLVQIKEPKNEIVVKKEKECLWFTKDNSKIEYQFSTETGIFRKKYKGGEFEIPTRSSLNSWFRNCSITTNDEVVARITIAAGGKMGVQRAAFPSIVEAITNDYYSEYYIKWESMGIQFKEVTEILENGGLNLSQLPSLPYMTEDPKYVKKPIRNYIRSQSPIFAKEMSNLCSMSEKDTKIFTALKQKAQEEPELFEVEEYQYGTGTYKTVSILDENYKRKKLIGIVNDFALDIDRFTQYLRQLRNWEHTNITWVVSNYRDYLEAELQLRDGNRRKMDKYPSNLVQAHHNKTSIMVEIEREKERLKHEKQKELDRAIYENTKQFEYCPEGEDYCIIAPKDAEDVFREGDKQNHCVGTYTKRISNKQSVILFMRKSKKMDEPLITIEINPSSGFNLCQALGRNNRRATPKERTFLEKYCDTHKVYDDNGKEASIFYTAYPRL